MAKANPALESNLIAVIAFALCLGGFPSLDAFLYLGGIYFGLSLGQFPCLGVGIECRRIHGAWSYRIDGNWRSRCWNGNPILGVLIQILLNPLGHGAAA